MATGFFHIVVRLNVEKDKDLIDFWKGLKTGKKSKIVREVIRSHVVNNNNKNGVIIKHNSDIGSNGSGDNKRRGIRGIFSKLKGLFRRNGSHSVINLDVLADKVVNRLRFMGINHSNVSNVLLAPPKNDSGNGDTSLVGLNYGVSHSKLMGELKSVLKDRIIN